MPLSETARELVGFSSAPAASESGNPTKAARKISRLRFPNLRATRTARNTANAGVLRASQTWSIGPIYRVFPLLEPLRHRRAGRLSGGEQQMLAIARTPIGNPALLLLDELSGGLAPINVHRIGELLKQLRNSGATALIAEQNMHSASGSQVMPLSSTRGRSSIRRR
jgi:ABC-type branched-subunit amino acid transport system ATPase component